MQEFVKFLTAGSVDDGKSTLIGRLLYDSNSLYVDHIAEVKKSTDASFNGELDFSLFLDGLASERAQKITIDVAYRYFNYQNKKFIIADAPGHEEYTPNMAVAAANSDKIIILIDAKKGVKAQTIRHSYIANLFGISDVIVAINKMDLVNFSEEIFNKIRDEYLEKTAQLNFNKIDFVPVIATCGDNILEKSKKIIWYKGATIIDYLSEISAKKNAQNILRLEIQNIAKQGETRYYQGLLSQGSLQVGDEIIAYPAEKSAKITKIIHSNNEVKNASAISSIAVCIDREIDIDRGSILAAPTNLPHFFDSFNCNLIWFSNKKFSLENNSEFLVKINHNYLRAKIDKINNIIDVLNPAFQGLQNEIHFNQIANINLNLAQKTAFDLFENNKNTASFLLIGKDDNETIACGIIVNSLSKGNDGADKQEQFLIELSQLVAKYFGENTQL